MDELLKRILNWMNDTYGDAVFMDGVCRVLVPKMGSVEAPFMLELSAISKEQLAEGHKDDVIQIFSTLATGIEDDVAPVLPEKLNQVTRTTLLGQYYYLPYMRYIVHVYRLQLEAEKGDEAFNRVMKAVSQITHQHDMYIDYILTIAQRPEELAFEDYRLGTGLKTF